MNRIEQAVINFRSKHNCAQAVTCAFCDLVGLEREEAYRISKKYGGGRYEVCGAVMGMFIIANFFKGCRDFDEPARRDCHTSFLLQLEEAFRGKNTTVVCRELRGVDGRTKLRSCAGCVEDAATILDDVICRNTPDTAS